MFKLAILDDWLAVSRGLAPFDDLEGVAPPVVFREHLAAPADVVSALEDFEFVSIMRERTPLPREVLEQLPNLRLLVTTGMHNAAVDLVAAAELGITVCGTDGVMTDTPELTWALLLAVVRDLPRQDRSVREVR